MASHGMVLLHTPHAQGHGLGHSNDCSKPTSAVSLPANPVILLPGYATARLLCCPVILLPVITSEANRLTGSL